MPQPASLLTVGRRLTWHDLVRANLRQALADDARRGLTADRKYLFPKYFYDDLGSTLFEAITLLPEYYLTRAEHEIFTRHADAIAGAVAGPLTLLELGSGSSAKTRILLEAVLRRQNTLHYAMMDISPAALEGSARVLLQAYPNLHVAAYAGDYFTALNALETQTHGRTLALLLGSNIGNFAYDEALEFLRAVRRVLQVGDGLLLGTDLRKDAATLEAAYDDSLGVTAAFNRNILARLNRELNADFAPRAFRHVAEYDATTGIVAIYLESRRVQTVRVRDLDLTVEFAAGERIHTENSCKYTPAQLAEMAAATGFVPSQRWLDEQSRFSSNLWLATPTA